TGSRALSALPPCTKFRRRFAGITAPVPVRRLTRSQVFRSQTGMVRQNSNASPVPAPRPPGDSRGQAFKLDCKRDRGAVLRRHGGNKDGNEVACLTGLAA